MSSITSIEQIDLTPITGKTYFNSEREWRDEFIYFLMIDSFQEDHNRAPVGGTDRTTGIHAPDNAFYGGSLTGIARQLVYIVIDLIYSHSHPDHMGAAYLFHSDAMYISDKRSVRDYSGTTPLRYLSPSGLLPVVNRYLAKF